MVTMIPLVLTTMVVLSLLVVNEWWWRGRTHGEISRKFIHVVVGSFVAVWPLFLTWRQIELLSLAFVIVVSVSQKLQIFRAIHSVQRPTWGEIFFAISVGAIAFITHSPVIYAAALLHMSLADGLAAIVGVKYGASQAYRVFGATKSLAGSMTFLVVSLAILAGYAVVHHSEFLPYMPLIAIGATVLENAGVKGLDNLLIPVLIGWSLSVLH
jgi:phytol kinase